MVRARGRCGSARTEVDAGRSEPPPFPGPEDGRPNDFRRGEPMFATHAMEIRFVEGASASPAQRPPGFACGIR